MWIRVVCVARMGPGVQRTKKNTPSGTFVLHRISNPENLLGRQKCYPYTNGVFFARSTDGCAAVRAAIGQICSISTVQRENPTCELYFHHRGRPSPRCGLQLTHCVPPHNSKSSKSTGSFKSSMRRPTIAVLATTAAALAPPRLALQPRRRRSTITLRALPTVSTEAQLQMCWRLVVAAASGSALGFERIGPVSYTHLTLPTKA